MLAGVPTSYIPINNIIERLKGILDVVENSKDKTLRERFSKVDRECNNYYRDICKSLKEQIEYYRELESALKQINFRRVEMNAPYAANLT